MGKKKREHFAEMKTFPCVFEPTNEQMTSGAHHMKGKWHEEFFKNDGPITLELGCGKGEYTIALAKKYPTQNFIGVDVKGARIWRGAKTADEDEMKNVAFLRTKIEFINTYFDKNEVDHIWLTFSDPQPKDKKGTKRITSNIFLERYRKFLKPDGVVHVKTDSDVLYEKTMEAIEEGNHQIIHNTDDLYVKDFDSFSPDMQEILNVKTFYEEKFLAVGKNIHYVSFRLSDVSNQA